MPDDTLESAPPTVYQLGEGCMKLTVQVVLHPDDGTETVVREVFTVHRESLAGDTLGLQLAEAKDLLAAVQDTLVSHQVSTALSAQVGCPDCVAARRHKDSRPLVMRTLFGRLRLDSPRWWHCGCQPQMNKTFSPLAAILPERTTPELSSLQARFAGLAAYGPSATLLAEVLPLGRRLHATTVRRQAHAVAQCLENELGDERWSFIDSCQRDRERCPVPTCRSPSASTAATSTPASSDPGRVRHLPAGQRRLHPQLRRTQPCRRGNLQLNRGVRRQPGDQQTY